MTRVRREQARREVSERKCIAKGRACTCRIKLAEREKEERETKREEDVRCSSAKGKEERKKEREKEMDPNTAIVPHIRTGYYLLGVLYSIFQSSRS